ncbi:MAG: replicative DNA helicase [Bacteroidales bacterium]
MNNEIAQQRKIGIKAALADQILLEQGKLPPQAVEVEQAVLGALMIDANALNSVIDILRPEYFYKPEHCNIFSVISFLFSESQPVDILTVAQELKKRGVLDVVGGAYYVSSLTNRVASAAHVEAHAKIIQQKYIQRELIRIGTEITKNAFEETTDVLELLDDAESRLLTIGENNFRSDYADMHVLVREAIKEVEEVSKQDSKLSGVPSGFFDLDRLTSGWQKGTLLIVAARPAMGKTAFALTMARNIAIQFKQAVAFFSLEMSAIELVTRLISSETQLNSKKLKQGDLRDYEWTQLNTKVQSLTESPLFIDDTPALTMFELRAKCRRLKQQHDIKMVFIDYLQLMRGGNDYKGNREQEISQISRQLKGLSKELKIPILALSQLSRAVETRGGTKKPQLSDLRESGAIEQDADMVIFIYRPEYYHITEDEKGSTIGKADILIEKHRSGSTGEVRLRFVQEYAKFENLSETEEEDGGNNSITPNTNFDQNSASLVTFPSSINEPIGF